MTPDEYRRLSAPQILSPNTYRFGNLPFTPLPFTQSFPSSFESEADNSAFEYLEKAGYDPNGLASFFSRIETLESQKPGSIAMTFVSHLHVPGRDQDAHAHSRSLRRDAEYIVNTSEFDVVKARLLKWTGGSPRLFSILLSAPNAVVTGSPVELEMTLTNIANRTVGFDSDGLFPYQIYLRDPVGRAVPDTEAGLQFKEKRRSAAIKIGADYFLKPGETVVSKCVLNDYYDITRPGTYFIQVEHRGTRDSPAASGQIRSSLPLPRPVQLLGFTMKPFILWMFLREHRPAGSNLNIAFLCQQR